MSSKRRIRRNACTGKRRFETEMDARCMLYAVKSRTGDGGMVPYRCQFCHAFHIGHPPKRVRQAMRAGCAR